MGGRTSIKGGRECIDYPDTLQNRTTRWTGPRVECVKNDVNCDDEDDDERPYKGRWPGNIPKRLAGQWWRDGRSGWRAEGVTGWDGQTVNGWMLAGSVTGWGEMRLDEWRCDWPPG